MDEVFLDRIDQAFLEGQIDGETIVLACLTLEFTLATSTVDSASHSSLIQLIRAVNSGT